MDNKSRKSTSSEEGLLAIDTSCRGMTLVELWIYNSPLFKDEFGQIDESGQISLDVLRLLLRETNNPPDFKRYFGQTEGFSLLQQSTDPFYYQRPLADRADVAFDLVSYSVQSDPKLMQLALGESIISAQAASLVATSGRTILHAVAYKLSHVTWPTAHDLVGYHKFRDGKDITKDVGERTADLRIGWRVYLRSILALRPNLHCISFARRTPLLELIRSCLIFDGLTRDTLLAVLVTWLEALHDSSIDLEEYGRKEIELYKQGLTSWVLDTRSIYPDGSLRIREIYILCFTYGPLPSDWDIVLKNQEPVPEKPARVPGGWIDDDDEEDEDGEDGEDEDEDGEDGDGDRGDGGEDDGEDDGGNIRTNKLGC